MKRFYVSIANWEDSFIYEVPEDCYRKIVEILREHLKRDPEPDQGNLDDFYAQQKAASESPNGQA